MQSLLYRLAWIDDENRKSSEADRIRGLADKIDVAPGREKQDGKPDTQD